MSNTHANIIRNYVSKPFVVVERDTLAVLGTSGNKARACAIGVSEAGENGYRVADLSDVDGFNTGAVALDSAYVSSLALGLTVREIAAHYRGRMDPRAIYADTGRAVTADDARAVVGDSIRETIGSLSRVAARRQVAEWILAGAAA